MRTDQRRNEDLTHLKSIGGLFVCAAELKYPTLYTWLALILTLMKFIRIYCEVWYARDTCLSMPNCTTAVVINLLPATTVNTFTASWQYFYCQLQYSYCQLAEL